MSNQYRQKLLNWFSSVLLVWACTLLALLTTLLFHIPDMESYGPEGEYHRGAGAIGESLEVYIVLSIPTLLWHFLDFTQTRAPVGKWGRRIFGYRAFVATLILVGASWLLIGTGYFTHNSCDDLDGALFYECFITISLWIVVPLSLGFLGLILLCIAKLFAAFDSLLLRAK